ncbi:MAG TPA: SigmaK-factor processing regulatory BofA [Firmicutes bacterium]|jgi:inhibitor of the pro-sigma K processing machinery|nr:SigmaK-factor processing regulatory BofA [Bacillota bacterium]
MSIGVMLTYCVALGLLYILGRAFWRPLTAVFQLLFRGALGAVGIYVFNWIALYWKMEIPINPFNSLFTGFLGIPGLISLAVLKYWIKI